MYAVWIKFVTQNQKRAIKSNTQVFKQMICVAL